MKTASLALLLLLSAASTAQTTGYLPLDIGNAWYFNNASSPSIKVVSEVDFGGRMYKKLYNVAMRSTLSDTMYLRSDSGRVYLLNRYSGSETLIYDFSCGGGDTLYYDSTGYLRICAGSWVNQFAGRSLRVWAFGYGSTCADCWFGEDVVDSIGWLYCGGANYDGELSKAVINGETVFTGVGRRVSPQPLDFALEVYPNPFNPVTTIAITLNRRSDVALRIFNSLGQEVVTLFDGTPQAGRHSFRWDASLMASGVYLCRLSAGNNIETKRVLLLK